jgi:hypothetical protein
MQFSDTTNKQGIIQDISWLTGADLNKYSIEDRTRSINEWSKTVWTWIMTNYGGWQFVDSNELVDGDIEGVTQDLTSGTSVYPIATALVIRKVEVSDDNDNWIKLKPYTLDQVGSETEFQSTAGTPAYYRPVGNKILIKPEPNYSKTDGLRVFFDKDMMEFTITDTIEKPGFDSTFHRILSIGPSLDYVMIYGPANKVSSLFTMKEDYKKRIETHYAKKFLRDFPPSLKVSDSIQIFK